MILQQDVGKEEVCILVTAAFLFLFRPQIRACGTFWPRRVASVSDRSTRETHQTWFILNNYTMTPLWVGSFDPHHTHHWCSESGWKRRRLHGPGGVRLQAATISHPGGQEVCPATVAAPYWNISGFCGEGKKKHTLVFQWSTKCLLKRWIHVFFVFFKLCIFVPLLKVTQPQCQRRLDSCCSSTSRCSGLLRRFNPSLQKAVMLLL